VAFVADVGDEIGCVAEVPARSGPAPRWFVIELGVVVEVEVEV
jgi:hypothetical protein